MKDILSEIIGRVKTEQNLVAETVTAGMNVSSFDDYQRLVGRHEGLKATLDIINDILTENDDES
jgi:hypothetical protein